MMYWYGDHGMSAWGWAVTALGMVVFWGVLIAAGVALFRFLSRSGQLPSGSSSASGASETAADARSAEAILAERFARGEIDENEYRDRLAALRGAVRG